MYLTKLKDGKVFFKEDIDSSYILNKKLSKRGDLEIFSHNKKEYMLYPSSSGAKFIVELSDKTIETPLLQKKTPLGVEMFTRMIEGINKDSEKGDGVERWSIQSCFSKSIASIQIGDSIPEQRDIAYSVVYGWVSRFNKLGGRKTRVAYDRGSDSVILSLEWES